MGELPKLTPKQDWVPSESAFRKFLDWLDEGNDSSGEKYLEMRGRLVRYFDRKSCLCSDELADETLNRVARRLEEQGEITKAAPAQYCYIVAKFVFLEHIRQTRSEATTSEADFSMVSGGIDVAQEASEPGQELIDCLESCLQQLPSADRELILEYYRGGRGDKIQHRRQLAEKMGLSSNALSIRACRIRDKLEACTRKCSAGR